MYILLHNFKISFNNHFYFDNCYNNYLLIIFFYHKNVDVFVSTSYIQRRYYVRNSVFVRFVCSCFFFLLNCAI